MLHGFDFSILVLLSTPFLRIIQMTVILTFFSTRDLDVLRTPNQTDSDVTFSRSCNQGKIAENSCGRLIDLLGQISKLSYFNLPD